MDQFLPYYITWSSVSKGPLSLIPYHPPLEDSTVLDFFQRTSFTQIWLNQVMLAIALGLQNIQQQRQN